jgi:hypothetical protein
VDAATFIAKWKKIKLTERSAAHQHFLDLCDVFDHPKPAEVDPKGDWYTFEKGVKKARGGHGWADVWKRGQFAWEYKKRHRDLDAAFDQLLQYVDDLDNPPILVACDMDRIVVKVRFTGYPTITTTISLTDLHTSKNLEFLRKVFHDPESLKPEEKIEIITEKATQAFVGIARDVQGRHPNPTRFAHFLDRLVFCMFAEDVGLLPNHIFTQILANLSRDPRHINKDIRDLFAAMAEGGTFWGESIPCFDGALFDNTPEMDLEAAHFSGLQKAATYDWSQMDPSIFGTLFERVMDPEQRSSLGAHYTSYKDIATLVDPVVMAPLRQHWERAKDELHDILPFALSTDSPKLPSATAVAKANGIVSRFLKHLRSIRILDPACGSGNFLYVALHKMLDLENEVLRECRHLGIPTFELQVGPHQLSGIEKNPYAHDLAQMTVWIGYLQWRREHGFPITSSPILQRLRNFLLMDAVLNDSDTDLPQEPAWPDADCIIGNPPFLGGNRIRGELGDSYVDGLFQVYQGRVPAFADLCCYWFEKSRAQIHAHKARRAGLLATQSIRGGVNRQVLKRIIESGGLFFAESDAPWVLNGANVHVSLIAFDDGTEDRRFLNGKAESSINSNLTAKTDTTQATRIAANAVYCWYGSQQKAKFDIPPATAIPMLRGPNASGLPSSDVLRLSLNATQLLRRTPETWVIDFGLEEDIQKASGYEMPFEYVKSNIYPTRKDHNELCQRRYWWLHARPSPHYRQALKRLNRYIVSPVHSKHRIFVWMDTAYLVDHATVVFIRDDDYFFGVLHSRLHEVWSRDLGTQVRERESGFRYTPRSCVETFPFPNPTPRQSAAIAHAARRLNELRLNWLNPPEWTQPDLLEFRGTVDGPWARWVVMPDRNGVGTVRYPRPKAKDAYVPDLAKRTYTALYNDRPTWLDLAHRQLDEAVFAAYGWSTDLSDEDILGRILELNLETDAGGPASSEDGETEDR